MEVAIAVAVGDGDDVGLRGCGSVEGGQPLQRPVQLTLAGALGLEEGKMKLFRGQKRQGDQG